MRKLPGRQSEEPYPIPDFPRGIAVGDALGLRPTDSPRKVVGYTYYGRPILANEDGSVATEESITVLNPELNSGRPTNIPSIYGGRSYGEDDAAMLANLLGQDFPSFDTIDDAEAAAQERTRRLGVMLDEGRFYEGEIPVPVRKPERR